eukprot:CAMPEP_0197418646 /NCGR_PEP_ID=MMETSP1170-20131217/4295_1 /TAXON_ID=54406 /ORGANISM="Sarcinochrysis sp, Strain CCMP770" /LENGTH=168 /DNA_ID=CAMNT_0042945697 /DNA_START=64 /DNA_END=566 /DNA_ORIENTATION=-
MTLTTMCEVFESLDDVAALVLVDRGCRDAIYRRGRAILDAMVDPLAVDVAGIFRESNQVQFRGRRFLQVRDGDVPRGDWYFVVDDVRRDATTWPKDVAFFLSTSAKEIVPDHSDVPERRWKARFDKAERLGRSCLDQSRLRGIDAPLVRTIDDDAFAECSAIDELNFP